MEDRLPHLQDHPNLPEVLSILARLHELNDVELTLLAQAWTTSRASHARSSALSPALPYIVDSLRALEYTQKILTPKRLWDEEVTSAAQKAVFDAVIAAYAKDDIPMPDYTELIRPWHSLPPRSVSSY